MPAIETPIEVPAQPNVSNPFARHHCGKFGSAELTVLAPGTLNRAEASQRRDLIGGIAEFGHHLVGVFAQER
jgi:hypothetical protein